MIHVYFVLVFVCYYVYDMLIVVLILQLFILLVEEDREKCYRLGTQ